MRVNREENLSYNYNGTNIVFDVHTLIHDDHVTNKITFNFLTVYIDMFYNESSDNCFSIMQKLCKVIEKFGEDGYKRFKDHYANYHMIMDQNIVLENKVYKITDINKFQAWNDIYYHMMKMELKDGTFLDGSSIFKQDYLDTLKQDKYSYTKTRENLKWKVQDYYKNHKVLPLEKYIDKELTDQFSNILSFYEKTKITL